MAEERVRYSDSDLAEFKQVILKKLEQAKADYELLRANITHSGDNDTQDTSPTFKVLEEGATTLSKEETGRLAAHQKEGMPTGAVVWIGDSITEQAWWGFLTKERPLVNRGIGGDNTRGMLARLPEILESSPRKIFFMGGVNDISGNRPVEEIFQLDDED